MYAELYIVLICRSYIFECAAYAEFGTLPNSICREGIGNCRGFKIYIVGSDERSAKRIVGALLIGRKLCNNTDLILAANLGSEGFECHRKRNVACPVSNDGRIAVKDTVSGMRNDGQYCDIRLGITA